MSLWVVPCFTIQILSKPVTQQKDWGSKQHRLQWTEFPAVALNPVIRVSCPKMSKLSGFLAPTQVKWSMDKMNPVFSWSVHLARGATWYMLKGVHSHAEDTFTDYSGNQRPGEGEGWVVRSQPCGKECEPAGWENGLANKKHLYRGLQRKILTKPRSKAKT